MDARWPQRFSKTLLCPRFLYNLNKTRPVWTGFKIVVRHKLLMHNNTRLYIWLTKKAKVNIIALFLNRKIDRQTDK